MARRLRWGAGNPLWEWQQRKLKASKPKTKRSVKKMARRRRSSRIRRAYGRLRRYRRGRDKRIPIAPTMGALVPVMRAYNAHPPQENLEAFLAWTFEGYTGYDYRNGSFDFKIPMMNFILPTAVGTVAHYIANAAGVNRGLRKVPLIGKYISI